ncbi:MAG: hypothetical protein NZM35_06965 [Chitinophagales bacterium]|nr:hypothetical protein [Chitinophagales bacterium]MDW8419095.1 hypothetical protein [Chitinophagales bacterium]
MLIKLKYGRVFACYFFTLPFLLFVLHACRPGTRHLCSQWKVYDVKFNVQSTRYSTVEQRKILHQLTNNFQFQFFRDSSYRVIKNNDTVYGKWGYDPNKKEIYTYLEGQKYTTEIISLDKKQFIFRPKDQSDQIDAIYCQPAKDKK